MEIFILFCNKLCKCTVCMPRKKVRHHVVINEQHLTLKMQIYPYNVGVFSYFCNYIYYNSVIIGMKNIIYPIICLLLTVCIMSIIGCGNSDKKEFNRLLLTLAESDHTIDNDDWKKLESYITSKEQEFDDFYENDKIDADRVKTYITEFFKNRRPATEVKFVGVGKDWYLTAKFYLERSGSMVPYDASNGDGRFKAAIVRMLNNLPNEDRNKIYVVNSSINEYPQGVRKFLSDNNIFEATKSIGDASYTDFATIFRDILDNTAANEISILVTDMIYSTKNMTGINPQKVFAEAQGMINSVFKKNVKEKSMLIIKMNSSFCGLYYSYNSPAGKKYDGERPYYIVIVSNKENIVRLTQDNKYSAFCKFKEMDGYENEYLFETSEIYNPHYSLLMSYPDINARYRPEKGQTSQIIEIEDIEAANGTSSLRLAVAVDLNGMFIDDDYLADKRNYLVESDDDIKIKEIKKINRQYITPAEKKYVKNATHVIVLETKKISTDQDVRIRLKNELPLWIEQSSSDNDSDLSSQTFASTTFGLKYLMKGIYESYSRNTEDGPYYFTLKLKFKQ